MKIDLIDRETCGGCGAYRSLHPTKHCEKPAVSWWWKRHYLHRHILNWLWIHTLTSKMRWWIAGGLEGKPGWHWCSLVDSCVRADDKDWHSDYQHPNGCLCDFPAPWDARGTRTCGYCAPVIPEETS